MIVCAAVAVFLVTYAFIATEKVHRVAAALGGVAAMTALGLVDADTAFFSQTTGIDWNVIFLLFGMMVIVGILKHTGLFEFLALWAARTSHGSPPRLLALLILVTAGVCRRAGRWAGAADPRAVPARARLPHRHRGRPA